MHPWEEKRRITWELCDAVTWSWGGFPPSILPEAHSTGSQKGSVPGHTPQLYADFATDSFTSEWLHCLPKFTCKYNNFILKKTSAGQ